MEITAYIAMILLPLIYLIIRADLTNNRKLFVTLKPLITIIIIITAFLSNMDSQTDNLYFWFIIGGLFFALAGDIALLWSENNKAFRIGLVTFLITHLFYTAGFSINNNYSNLDIWSGSILLLLLVLLYTIFHRHLKSMKIWVIIYMVVISLMVGGAISTLDTPFFSDRQSTRIIAGAILFYISDIILAWNRFYKPFRHHRVNLAFYYCGQFLIALSLWS